MLRLGYRELRRATVKLHGQYEWTENGGTVHWTHRDNRGSHEAGWIEFKGTGMNEE
jgi:hypothetical protein